MSYLVLARKYRPQTFADVIGQEHVTRTLQNAIRRGRVHHAFLFCGGRGTGKTTTARILAKALSCVNAPTPEPCNVCPACVEITQGTSVDVQEIDAASQNRVEDIRELREAIRYAPVRGKKKLYILDEVHMLSTSAFNALLKTLEEPPPHAVFVFATTDPHKLPQTILSRVQRYDFKLVPTARLTEHLSSVLTKEGIAFDPAALQLISREGQGSVRDSMSLLDQVLASTEGTLTEEQASAVLGVADRGLIVGLGRAIVDRDPARALELIDSAYGRGFDLSQLAKTLLAHLRDLLVISVVKDPLPLLEATPSELEELKAQAERARGRAELLFHRMLRVADETSRASLPRYVLEVGVVELCGIEPMQPVGELVDRLESLEERLSGAAPARPRPAPSGGPGAPSGEDPRPFAASTGLSTPRSAAPSAPVGASTERPLSPPASAGPAPAAKPPTTSHVAATGASQAAAVAASPAVAAIASVAEHVAPVVPATIPAIASEPAAEPAPPSPEGAPPATLSPPGELPDFHTALNQVMAQDPTLVVLHEARKLHWQRDKIVLGFPKEFFLDSIEKKRADAERVLSAICGCEVSLSVQLDQGPRSADPSRWSLRETHEQQSSDEKAARKREAETHPARQLLSQAFGAVSFVAPTLLDEVS